MPSRIDMVENRPDSDGLVTRFHSDHVSVRVRVNYAIKGYCEKLGLKHVQRNRCSFFQCFTGPELLVRGLPNNYSRQHKLFLEYKKIRRHWYHELRWNILIRTAYTSEPYLDQPQQETLPLELRKIGTRNY